MTEMNLVNAYLFGLTLAFAVGPMALLIVQRCISKGFKSALFTSLGIATADFTYALIALSVGVSVLLFIETYEDYVHLFSGVVLLGLALHIAYSAIRTYKQHIQVYAAKAKGNDFVSAYALTMHNPMTVAVFLGFLGYMIDIQSIQSIVLFAFVLFLGSFSGQFVIGITAAAMRNFFRSPKSIVILNCISAVGIGTFAVASFLKALHFS